MGKLFIRVSVLFLIDFKNKFAILIGPFEVRQSNMEKLCTSLLEFLTPAVLLRQSNIIILLLILYIDINTIINLSV